MRRRTPKRLADLPDQQRVELAIRLCAWRARHPEMKVSDFIRFVEDRLGVTVSRSWITENVWNPLDETEEPWGADSPETD